MSKKLLIIGAGGHGHVVAEIASACGYTYSFLDDNSLEAIGKICQIQQFSSLFDFFFVAMGNNIKRQEITGKLEALNCQIPIIIHPTAYVSPSAQIGEGTVIAPGAVVNTRSCVGKGCIISVGALIDHDVVIEDFTHINAGAVCKAGSHISKLTKVDAGVVIQGF